MTCGIAGRPWLINYEDITLLLHLAVLQTRPRLVI